MWHSYGFGGRLRGRLAVAGGVIGICALLVSSAPPVSAAAGGATPQAATSGDYADGHVLSILPPGENGLVTAANLATGSRPTGFADQLPKYAGLLYGYPGLTDAGLGQYYDQESFGVPAGQLTRVEHPAAGVVIQRDAHDVPHITGSTDTGASFGAGYAQAEDRLFLMDVLRHYGAGTLAQFVGPSCADEQMDHDQLLLAPYTAAQGQAQIDALPREYGQQGTLAKQMIDSYVQGINAYVTATRTDPSLLPADYAAAVGPPQLWQPADVVDIAGLIGGIFGRGGGTEVANSALYQYLVAHLGPTGGPQAFAQFKEQNDPAAPTTVVDKAFPYEIPGPTNPALTAIPDHPTAALTGGPTGTTPGCQLSAPNPTALATVAGLQTLPKQFSNALLVDGKHSADGHPIAVFGPQVSYFAPQILAEEEISAPDYHAEGASFPGTGLVELGRGPDFAWSATSAGSDLIDQRLERICNPGGGAPAPQGTYYSYQGRCLPMTHEVFQEVAYPKPGGIGAPTVINHDIYLTVHGVVQGWTTAAGGQPVAVANQRSTYGHDVDSAVGFLRWGEPALTHDPQSWMQGAAQISYTFNWMYADSSHIAYYVSGADPIRPAGVDPNLPTWGTGSAEWQGFLPANQHVHETDPPQGFFVSWNNKPAPQFSAADDQYGYGPVYRSQMLTAQIQNQFAAHGGKITRAQLVQAMETAATQDLDGLTVLPQLLAYLHGRPEPPGVTAMLDQLSAWYAAGSHRRKAAPGDSQYQHAAAVAIMDELVPNLIQAIYDPIFAAGGVGGQGSNGGATTPAYSILPMQWVNTPNSGGAHLGSAYDGGWEGYLQKTLQQLQDQSVPAPFTAPVTDRWCGSGPAGCPAAIDATLASTYQALVKANGGSSDVASWTASSASAAASQTMPQYDSIHFKAIGAATQPNIDWQNRPTFQQVVEFMRHR